jgi:hypothetical protein
MPTKKAKLSVAQQKMLMKTISATQLNHMKRHCLSCKMGGSGLGDIWRSVKNTFKKAIPFIGDIGGKVLKDVLLPLASKKLMPIAGNLLSKVLGGSGYSGQGLRLAGQKGKGLRLSGGSKQVVPTRKSPKLHLG